MASSILCALGGFRRVTSRSDLLSIRRATAPSDFGREEARFIERLIRPRGRKSGQRHKGVNSIPTVISNCPRTGQKGSGVAAFALGALDVNMIVTKPYKSLECLDLTVKTGSIVLRLVVMYRPPKLCTVSVFFEEFSELLETLIPAEGRLFISGDMNFHVDDVENRDAQRLLDLIHSMGLVQHMQVATHQKGHTLDLIITLSGQGTI
ncbi:hypothetical protein Pmani_014602 [Petrolisthes manimaculis]|uniref:Endonuclease/exonuclease/phosphatase domain-containing protein n=1 Tax=Petrolisthes manimaculis TaxID=1843537 RepID=A0AAE1PTB1_9EUCA|nr:hypothetical protein Pmani_022206 [Petrolisthes manimaculis]KAK4314113.1 hypothetical protein Pmani_014602 [Petrolisthes manimaculis]